MPDDRVFYFSSGANSGQPGVGTATTGVFSISSRTKSTIRSRNGESEGPRRVNGEKSTYICKQIQTRPLPTRQKAPKTINNFKRGVFLPVIFGDLADTPYLCIVFFMVLDLRLTMKIGCRETTFPFLYTYLYRLPPISRCITCFLRA